MVDGSPEPSSTELVKHLAAGSDYVVAADRGAQVLFAAGVVPHVYCGDDDSALPEVAAWAHEGAAVDIRFPSEKYATDLALALDCARHEAVRRGLRSEVTVTCASGGRLDHQLAVIGLLATNADLCPRIVEDGLECRILSSSGVQSWELGAEEHVVGSTASVIALAEGTVVSERGMRWDLDCRELSLLGDLGVSNVVMSPEAVVTCHAGVVAVFLLRDGR